MTWVKRMYVFEEDYKFKLTDHAGLCTAVFSSSEERQWWIDNYYRKIGVSEFAEGKPLEGEVIAVVVKDSVLRDFVSRVVAYRYGDAELIDCDLTRGFCKRLLLDPSELVGKVFVWELPLPARSFRQYEEEFIEHVVSNVRTLNCVVVLAAREGCLPKVIERMCTHRVDAILRDCVLSCRRHDYRTGSRLAFRIPLVEGVTK